MSSQFHETLHNVPKIAAVHHSMNNFFTAEKEDTDVFALATKPNLDMHDTSNKSALPFLAISRKNYYCFTLFQRQAKLIDKCLNVFSPAACIEGDDVMIPEASTTANPKQQEFNKAKLVAKGYAQTYGIGYEKTYSPVAK
jgi:hypothetical protein